MMDAEVMGIKKVQEKSFMTDKKQLKIEYQRSQLNLRIHTDGIISVHGRMTNADLPEETITSIPLPKKACFATLLIKDVRNHLSLAQIRSKYWLPQGRAQVKQVLAKCLTCIKHQGGPYKIKPMAPWPKIKVNE